MLTLEQAKLVYDALSIGYKPVESRMQFKHQKDNNINHDEITQHVIGYKLPKEYQDNVVMFDSVGKIVSELLKPYIYRAIEIINKETTSANQIFLIMSTNWCGKPRHFKHIHTLIQDNPQRCITLSVPIPLYIDETDKGYHHFHWHYQPMLYPKITYTSAERMEKINREYISMQVPKNSTSSILFDSSRTIHYIDNSSHLYLWVVADGVELLNNQTEVNGLQIKLH
jgi:hypothetical protein